METAEKQTTFKKIMSQPVVMPDGTEPLPLGSGTIRCLLGVGGAANVYKIWNPQLESYRAVKLLKPDLAQEWRKRFQTEMKIMAALSHPNIIEIHTVGVWNSLDFIEMELIDGTTLADLITGKGALPVQACVAIAVMVARALVHAHDQKYVLFGTMYHGIIHRDIKPSNIMVAQDGRIKLMDFGIARPITTSLLTTTDGGVVGTIQYMAPEQLNGTDVDVTTDIYALGTILYEMLTGEKAFPHLNLSELFDAKTKNEFVPLRLFNLSISKRLKRLVNSCMSYSPGARPQTAADLLEELEAIHYSASDKTCESTLKHFLQKSSDDKTIHFARTRRLMPLAIIAGATIVAVCAITGVTMALKGKANAPAAAAVPHTIPAPAPAAAPEVQPRMAAPAAAGAVLSTRADKDRSSRAKRAVVTTKEPDIHRSYLDETKARLGVSDPLEAMAKEAEAGKFESALKVYAELPPDAAADPSAQLFRLRSLYALGNTAQVAGILNAPSPVNDGEFFLIKAKSACDQGKIDLSLSLLDKALEVKARNLDAEELRRDCLFCRAQCMSRRFDTAPTEPNRKEALDSWFEVKNTVRKYPAHAYYKKAVSEMQRIGESSVHDKG
jgi:tRNA A-37 threonylcarbamoyl transferase component Bud32